MVAECDGEVIVGPRMICCVATICGDKEVEERRWLRQPGFLPGQNAGSPDVIGCGIAELGGKLRTEGRKDRPNLGVGMTVV